MVPADKPLGLGFASNGEKRTISLLTPMRAGGTIVKQLAAAAVLAVSAMGSAVAAPLMGSTLNYTYYYPVLGSTYAGTPNPNGNFVVGPGEEIYSLTDGVGSLDVTA